MKPKRNSGTAKGAPGSSQIKSNITKSQQCSLRRLKSNFITPNPPTLVDKSAQASQLASSDKIQGGTPATCAGCKKLIKRDKFLLMANDKYWHENCLRCDRCNIRLGELGSSLFHKNDMNLCRQDYLEMFGKTGVCSLCQRLICASEMVMKARDNVYHLECFACQLCGSRFCVGDKFYLCENRIVCEYDYEEHILPMRSSLNGQQEVIAILDSIQPIPPTSSKEIELLEKPAEKQVAEIGAINDNNESTEAEKLPQSPHLPRSQDAIPTEAGSQDDLSGNKDQNLKELSVKPGSCKSNDDAAKSPVPLDQ